MHKSLYERFPLATPLLAAVFAATVAFGADAVAQTFTEPSAAPPSNNAYAPLDTGPANNTKSGKLILNSSYWDDHFSLIRGATGASFSADNYLNIFAAVGKSLTGVRALGVPISVTNSNGTTEYAKLDVSGYVKASTGYCIGTSCITTWSSAGGTEADTLQTVTNRGNTTTQSLEVGGIKVNPWGDGNSVMINGNQVYNQGATLYLQWSAPNSAGVVIGGAGNTQDLTLSNGTIYYNGAAIQQRGDYPIYYCPVNTYTEGGDWASFGCIGQYTPQSYCTNWWWNGGSASINLYCTYVGRSLVY